MTPQQKGIPLISMFLKIQRKYHKNYSWPAQKTQLELMDLYQGIKKSRATLNRWLRVLVDEKYLIRRRRIKRDPERGLLFKSSLYKITIKGYRLLSAFGVDMSREIAAYEKWLEEINPERKILTTKKMLAAAKRNPRHEEFMAGIVESLEKRHVVA